MQRYLILLLLTASCFAQSTGSCKSDIVLTKFGTPAPGATIQVCADNATGAAGSCTPTTLIYSDEALTNALGNPFHADRAGNYQFCAAPGHYIIDITYGATKQRFQSYLVPAPRTPPGSWAAPLFVDNGTTSGLVGEYSPQKSLRLTRIRVRPNRPWTACTTPGTLTVTIPATAPAAETVAGVLTIESPVRPNAAANSYQYVFTAERVLNTVVNTGQPVQLTYAAAVGCSQYPQNIAAVIEYDGGP